MTDQVEKKFKEIKKILAEAEIDIEKYVRNSNKSAGTRIRKSLMDIKTIATDIRKDILETRKK